MTLETIPFKVEPMTLADIPAGLAVDRAAYGANFSPRNYSDELENNRLAHYFVIRPVAAASTSAEIPSASEIAGLGGFWLIAGELHVITLAIHPHYQRLGLGAWLLLFLIEEGQKLGAEIATLEVRVSNQVAIALYQKYGFQEVGRRPGYYTNNGEDALIFTTPPLQSASCQALLAEHKAQLWERLRRQR
jgi:ribosomal-protein-alanine N-acetyltransferase